MRERTALNLAAATLLGFALLPGSAASRQGAIKDQIVGAWKLVSLAAERDDGSKTDLFGPNPKGIIIFRAFSDFMESEKAL